MPCVSVGTSGVLCRQRKAADGVWEAEIPDFWLWLPWWNWKIGREREGVTRSKRGDRKFRCLHTKLCVCELVTKGRNSSPVQDHDFRVTVQLCLESPCADLPAP